MGNKKNNILIVHNYYQIPGGEDRVAENECEMLRKHGHKVIFYSRDNKEINDFGKVKKLFMAADTVFSLKTFFEVRALIKREKIDIVHVHNTLNLISPSVYYAASSCKVPVVQTMHNYRMLCPAGTFFRKGHICEKCADLGLMCAVKGKCYKNSGLYSMAIVLMNEIHRLTGIYKKINYICLTEFGREKLFRLNEKKQVIDAGKVWIKPNFTEDTDEKDIVKADLPYGEKDYYVVIGRIEALKGSAMITSAFLKNKKNLVFVGSGEQSDMLAKKIVKNDIKNIFMTGQLSREETAGVLRGARALIVGSRWYETFGMTIIEAYKFGIPVIAGDMGAYGSLVKDGITGIKFGELSPEGLNNAIERFEKSDINKKDILYEYKEKYSEEKNYENLSRIYAELK